MSALKKSIPKVPRMRGRPTLLTPKLSLAICEAIENGGSLVAICEGQRFPSRATVMRWVATNPEFRDMYSLALAGRAHTLAEEIIGIGDAATVKTVHLARLRCDNRKWFASKLAPRVYGDRTAHELSGPDGKPIQVQPVPAAPLSRPEVRSEINRLVAKAEAGVGLKAKRGAPLERRLAAVLEAAETAEVLHPDAYELLWAARQEAGHE